jgi:hypothetical protein
MTPTHESELHRREADFHDEWALATPLDQILVRFRSTHRCGEPFHPPPDGVSKREEVAGYRRRPGRILSLLCVAGCPGDRRRHFTADDRNCAILDVKAGVVAGRQIRHHGDERLQNLASIKKGCIWDNAAIALFSARRTDGTGHAVIGICRRYHLRENQFIIGAVVQVEH